MNTKKPNPELVLKQIDEVLVRASAFLSRTASYTYTSCGTAASRGSAS